MFFIYSFFFLYSSSPFSCICAYSTQPDAKQKKYPPIQFPYQPNLVSLSISVRLPTPQKTKSTSSFCLPLPSMPHSTIPFFPPPPQPTPIVPYIYLSPFDLQQLVVTTSEPHSTFSILFIMQWTPHSKNKPHPISPRQAGPPTATRIYIRVLRFGGGNALFVVGLLLLLLYIKLLLLILFFLVTFFLLSFFLHANGEKGNNGDGLPLIFVGLFFFVVVLFVRKKN